MKYDVNADIYEGPLPLLVELAKLNLLDLFIIKIQDLTSQYLEMVKSGAHSINDIAEPLPLFGQLVAMKARALLPHEAPIEELEVPISLEELERRLKEYEKFKTVAQVLSQLHALQRELFTRARKGEVFEEGQESAERLAVPVEVELVDLMSAFTKVLEKSKVTVYELETEPWTVEMKVDELSVMLAVKKELKFHELFSAEKTPLELVVTFLALLELVRRRACIAVQERHFGEILIVKRQDTGSPN